MSKGEIPRHPNGLINFDELECYFPSPRLRVPFGTVASLGLKNHHAYYYYRTWNQHNLPEEERNQTLIDFRSKPFNRLILQKRDEERLHRDFEEVDPSLLDDSVAEASIRDFDIFNELGAASIGLNLVRNPRRRYSFDGIVFNGSLAHISREERLSFFSTRRDEALDKIEHTEATPESVVTSVIRRYGQHLRDRYLAQIAYERTTSSSVVHPFDLPSHQYLKDLSIKILREAFPIDEPLQEEAEAA